MSVSAGLSLQAPIQLGPRAAVHLLNRIGYGPRPGDIERVLQKGFSRYVDEQLSPGPDGPLESRLSPLTTLGYPIAQVLTLYASDQTTYNTIVDQFNTAKFIRAVHGENQLQEVLVDFWYNHFNVNILDGFVRYSAPAYERDVIRKHAMGKFRDLLAATAEHPAMLFYLDNYLSTVSRVVNGRLVQGLNENYGRELMELHTVGVTAGYSQNDVFEAARCFTGWTIDQRAGVFVYRAANHDTGAKNVFGLNVPAGGNKSDGDQLINFLASHEATAHFVSRKLIQRFVADEAPARLVERVAAVFLDSDGDIREVMRAILSSTEFWAAAFGAGKPKTPIEYVVSALRAVDAQVTASRSLTTTMQAVGMPLYQCLPPTGYSNAGGDWANPSGYLARMNFSLDLTGTTLAGIAVDVRGLVTRMGGRLDNARSIVDAVNREIFGGKLSSATVEAASRAAVTGTPTLAARVMGLLLAGPEMQKR
jgi:uncharacterized protein (DUF1800 family)